MTPLTAEDEPPSPEPRAAGRPDATASSPPTVTAADERTEDATPVALADLAALLSRVLAHEGAPSGAEASLTLVDADAIARLKVEHLDGDGASTDVLSFPVDGVAPDAELIGDVVLCPQVAAAQAPNHAGRVDDEMALLVVHGGLHLAGWDHASDADRIAMWERERDLLTMLYRVPARNPWSEQPS
jgi:probable rRNA maturation factor